MSEGNATGCIDTTTRAPLKILLVLHELSLTGAPRVALDTLAGLGGHQVMTLALYPGPLEERCRSLGPTHLLFPVPHRRTLYGRVRRRLWKRSLETSVRRFGPDIVYVNSVAGLRIFDLLALPTSVPVLLHVHEMGGALARYCRGAEQRLLERPAVYVAVSEAVKASLVAMGVAENRVRLVYPAVPAQGAVSADTRRADGRVTIAGIGYLAWCKGPELWLLTAAELVARVGHEGVRFVWLGADEGEAREHFLQMVRLLGLSDVVEVLPSSPEPYRALGPFDLLLLSSWEDSCPLVVIESMARGCPAAVFSMSGGATEVVGDCGVQVTEFSPSRMAEAIAGWLDKPEELAVLGRRCAERVAEHFVPSAQLPKMREIITELGAMSGQGRCS